MPHPHLRSALDSNVDTRERRFVDMKDYRVLIALIALAYLFLDPGSAHAYIHRVPEPATLTLLGVGAATLGGISLLRRRKK